MHSCPQTRASLSLGSPKPKSVQATGRMKAPTLDTLGLSDSRRNVVQKMWNIVAQEKDILMATKNLTQKIFAKWKTKKGSPLKGSTKKNYLTAVATAVKFGAEIDITRSQQHACGQQRKRS